MTQYQVRAVCSVHSIDATTYVIDAQGLRFVSADGVTVAIFTAFDWMRIAPAVVEEPAA